MNELLDLLSAAPFWVSVLLGSLAMIGTFAGWRGLRIPAWLRLLLTLSTAGLVLFAFGLCFNAIWFLFKRNLVFV